MVICANVNNHCLSDSSCSKLYNFADLLKYHISNFEVLSQISLCLQGKFINCDWIYGNRSKSHIGSYEIIDFEDFNIL